MTTKRAALQSLSPLIIDAGVPVATYYLLTGAAGMSTLSALAWSSAVPAARTLWSLARGRINALAAVILLVNVTGLALSLVAGDPRLMLAKDSGVTSVLGIAILVSVLLGKPLMTTAVRPWITKGDPAKLARWQRLGASSTEFRRAERVFSVVWGVALLAECVVRVVGAYTLPVGTMVWLGPVILAAAIVLAFRISGKLAVGSMERLMAVAK